MSVAKKETSAWDRALARICENCPACRSARQHGQGAAYWLVTRVEGRVCPFCRAYARVHGKPAHASTVETKAGS